jgi:hypothetical protein
LSLLLIFRLTPLYMLVMMVYIVTVTYFQVDSTVYVSDDGLYCTVTYFQVDSTVYVSDDGLPCPVSVPRKWAFVA